MGINKKILATGLSVTAGLASVGTIAGVALNTQQQSTSIVENNNNENNNGNVNENLQQNKPIYSADTRKSYNAQIRKSISRTNETKYIISIEGNIQKEGVAWLVDNDGNMQQEMEFTPGTQLTVEIKMNEGYEAYTARELRIIGKNPSYGIPSKNVENEKNKFTIKMPTVEETTDKKTGESWLYGEDAGVIKLVPTFIKESIGTDGNDVNWEHGAWQDTLNGYVYELKEDTTWTSATKEIYETFENKEITNPIDIFFYLNGHTITFDVDKINLDVPSGWALHFYNNKTDSKAANGKYGEIRVGGNRAHAELEIGGAVALGSSVKFKQYAGINGIRFVNFESGILADTIENDPVQRLGK